MRQTRKRVSTEDQGVAPRKKKAVSNKNRDNARILPNPDSDDFITDDNQQPSGRKKASLSSNRNYLREVQKDKVKAKSSSQSSSTLKVKQTSESNSLSERFGYKKKTKQSLDSTKSTENDYPKDNNNIKAVVQNVITDSGGGIKQCIDKFKQTTSVNTKDYNADKFISELDLKGFQKGNRELRIYGVQPKAFGSCNMVHCLQQMAFGFKSRLQLQEAVKSPLVELYKDFRLSRVASPFDRRVTAIEWHPRLPHIVAVGSKGGDIILWNTQKVEKDFKFIQGIGAAGSCQAMKFWPWDLDKVVSASINGTVTLHDFEGRDNNVLADTMDSYDHWYCSVDVNPSRYMVAAGRNGGILHLMSSEGRKIFEYRLHKNKITHVEFSPREEWLLCTASTDQTVQFWDVRNMKDRKSVLSILKHDKPVNSAYFSQTDGCRLLTTDQKNEIRVYKAPDWNLETTIQHPHRFFQHITPFKATWHPLVDLIICGRYPDKEFPGYVDREPRTLDMFDAKSGEIVAKLYDPEVDGLCPLNKFNHQGDTLVSGMGFHIKLWERGEVFEESKQKLVSSTAVRNLMNGANSTVRSRSSRDLGGDGNDTDDLKKKKKRKPNTAATTKESKSKTKITKKTKEL